MGMDFAAHFWTIWPALQARAWPHPPLAAEEWSHVVDDPDVGPVRLTGQLRGAALDRTAPPRDLVVLVHGLGGSTASLYLARAVRAAQALGLATLSLNLRGADRSGADLYHAGLTDDLKAALRSPRLAAADNLYVLGYSLGGHVTLRFATDVDDPRVRAVAAVCSPLDLERTVRAFDRPSRWLYRRHVLSGLFDIYDQVARRRAVPVPPEAVRRARTLREFDRLAIVPRFGFDSVDDYYRRAGVGSRLHQLRVPALLVAAEGDPMVDVDGIRPALAECPPRLDVYWAPRGGHVSFPADLDLGMAPPYGLEPQVLRWLVSQGGSGQETSKRWPTEESWKT